MQGAWIEPAHVEVEAAAAVVQGSATDDLALAREHHAQVADGLLGAAQAHAGLYRLHRQALGIERACRAVADRHLACHGQDGGTPAGGPAVTAEAGTDEPAGRAAEAATAGGSAARSCTGFSAACTDRSALGADGLNRRG